MEKPLHVRCHLFATAVFVTASCSQQFWKIPFEEYLGYENSLRSDADCEYILCVVGRESSVGLSVMLSGW